MGWPLGSKSLSETAYRRLMGLFLWVPTTAVLVVAALLEPAPEGFGTHTQLGLGQCSFLSLVGLPCPMCGMTTTFSLMIRGQWIHGFLNQPFGSVLYVMVVGASLLGMWELLAPRGRVLRLFQWLYAREILVFLGLASGVAVGWVYKIMALGAL